MIERRVYRLRGTESHRSYYARNRQRVAINGLAYRKANAEKIKQYQAAYRASKRTGKENVGATNA